MSEPTPNPQKVEAKADEPVTFTFDGDEYIVPPADAWELDALDEFEQGHDLAFMRSLLGDQWATFRKNHKNRKDLSRLYEAWQKELGLGN